MSEAVLVARTGRTLQALIDPAEHKLYFPANTDVLASDTLTFRGFTTRVTGEVEVWDRAGVVVTFDKAGAAQFPDVGSLMRPSGGGFNRSTKTYDQPASTTVWSGPCSVEVEDQGTPTEVTEQMVSTQVFTVRVPITVLDVRPDDVFVASTSRDARLVGRRLVVTRVESGTEAESRAFRVVDNQG